MVRMTLGMVLTFAALTVRANEFSAEEGLARARQDALAPTTDRLRASTVVWKQGGGRAS